MMCTHVRFCINVAMPLYRWSGFLQLFHCEINCSHIFLLRNVFDDADEAEADLFADDTAKEDIDTFLSTNYQGMDSW